MPARIDSNDIRSLYMSLPIAACLVGREKLFLAANDKYAELMGTPLSSIIGATMFDINPKRHIDNVDLDFAIFDQGGIVEDHEVILRDRILLVSVSPFYRGSERLPSAISVTLQDITVRKNAETALVVANQELNLAKQEIERLAYVDAVTLIPNRRAFDIAITREIGISRRQKSPLTVVMADVDFFKRYNDLYGHLEGDACLAAVAAVISGNLRRPSDFCARYGGEEFVIILAQTGPDGAFRLIEHVRESIQNLALPHSENSSGIVTMSFGISGIESVPKEVDTDFVRELLIEQADQARYKAKASGRNRVAVGGTVHSE